MQLVDPAGEAVGVEQFELVKGCSPALEAPWVQWRASSPGSGCCRAVL